MNSPQVISPYILMRIIGFLAFSLPFILLVSHLVIGPCSEMLPTISNYYHSVMRDIFVCMISGMAICFFAYVGYEKKVEDKLSDNFFAKCAALCALGLALFPTVNPGGICHSNCVADVSKISSQLHYFFAASLFLLLAYFALKIFTKSDNVHAMTAEKKMRNKIYKSCGYTILVCIVLIIVYSFFVKDKVVFNKEYAIVFWLETICLLAFSLSWMVKGELLMNDTK